MHGLGLLATFFVIGRGIGAECKARVHGLGRYDFIFWLVGSV